MSVRANAYWSGGKLRLVDPHGYAKGIAALEPSDGESFVIVVMREADAKRHHQLKYLFGYLYKQVSAHTGYPFPAVDAMLRGLFLPHDVPTLSLMSYDQMREFILQCEAYAASTIGISIAGPDDARHWKAA